MNYRKFTPEEQASGAFNGGEIVENKPIGFPQDGGSLKPYSNLFYWAHAYTADKPSTIGLHPHRGFEIASFVLTGSIAHYDSMQQKWIPLHAGDVQIIRSGDGISHAEHLEAHSSIFQIWFDPNLQKTLQRPASYSDYSSADIPQSSLDGAIVWNLAGQDGIMEMEAEGIDIKRYQWEGGSIRIPSKNDYYYSIYVIQGDVRVNGNPMQPHDFVQISPDSASVESSHTSIEVVADGAADLFVIASPASPGYQTYADQWKNRS